MYFCYNFKVHVYRFIDDLSPSRNTLQEPYLELPFPSSLLFEKCFRVQIIWSRAFVLWDYYFRSLRHLFW